MPGAYAHLTLVNVLKEPNRLEATPDFPVEAVPAVLDYFKYCELGAVSPDYPYLAVGDRNAAKWADAMHYTRTGSMIHAGIWHLRGVTGETRRKGLAWLLGYAAHVAMDVTVHPVVELKVGPYEQNKTDHRECEMHQDAYIFQRLNLGDVGLSEHLDTGVCACGSNNERVLDPDIRILWEHMLHQVHPDAVTSNPPDIDKWHRSFKKVVDNIAEEGNKLLPLARHVAVNLGLTYPARNEVNADEFINNLRIPIGRISYDQVFDKAVSRVGEVWALVASGVLQDDDSFATKIGDWNLDNGKDNQGRFVFWS